MDSGLDAQLGHGAVHAALRRVEEGLVAQDAVDEVEHLERFAGRRGGFVAGGSYTLAALTPTPAGRR